MEKNLIHCPNCNHEINVNEALYAEIKNKVGAQYKEIIANKERELMHKESKMKKELQNSIKKELEDGYKSNQILMEKKLKENSEELKNMQKIKAEAQRLKKENKEIAEKTRKEYEQSFKQRLSTETMKIMKKAESDSERKVAERDLVIKQLKKLASEAKLKAEQGSMQIQGEAQEICIEQFLRKNFPEDEILEVKKGMKGGDCIHKVINSGKQCAVIYYESKRTKIFQISWIEKLKQDMIRDKANVGVIITEKMPNGAGDVFCKDGIWVCTYAASGSLCLIIREFVIKAYSMMDVSIEKDTKMEQVYDYLNGDEFRMNIENIFSKFAEMKLQLEKERSESIKLWKKREEQIDAVIKSTTGICISIKQITGTAAEYPEIEGALKLLS